MKRMFTFVAVIAMTVSAFALNRNIFAAGLKASATTDDNKVEIEYCLHSPAIALEVQILKEDGGILNVFPITDPDMLVQGVHKTTLDLHTVLGGKWQWAIEAKGAPNPAPDGEEDDPILEQVNHKGDTVYTFYSPRGVVVDNSFESEYLGNVYVTEAWDGDTDGESAYSRAQKRGLFIYNWTLNFAFEQNQNNMGFLGGVGFSDSADGMRTPDVDADGNVYVCDKNVDKGTTGVWMVNPAHPEDAFAEVIDVTKRGTLYTKAVSIAAVGSGDDRAVYVLDNMGPIVRFPIGNGALPYTAAPDTVFEDVSMYNVVNAQSTLRNDTKGGFWVFQYRGQRDAYPMCIHINKKGEVDFQIVLGTNDDIAPTDTYRGAGATSPDGKYLAIGGGKSVNLYEIEWSGSKVSSLKKVTDYEFPVIGINIDGIAFDIANNVYVVSASTEYMYVFAIPTEENTCVTKAPTKYMIESKSQTGLEELLAGKGVKKGVYSLIGTYLGENAEGLPAGMYIINGKKVIK